MKLQSFTLFPYKTTCSFAGIPFREGLHILWQSNLGAVFSEAAPLPGFSKETLIDALDELQKQREKIIATLWDKEHFYKQLVELSLLPSVHFALYAALDQFFYPEELTPQPIAALFAGSQEQILARAKRAKEEGISVAKLKIGHLKKEQIAYLIPTLCKEFKLRIDANGKFEERDLLPLLDSKDLARIDYFEEIKNAKSLPLAIDETLRDGIKTKGSTWIVKPALGMQPLFEKEKEKIVLSSSFETGVGLYQIARLSKKLGLKESLGIDTFAFLENCYLPLKISEGKIYFPTNKQILDRLYASYKLPC